MRRTVPAAASNVHIVVPPEKLHSSVPVAELGSGGNSTPSYQFRLLVGVAGEHRREKPAAMRPEKVEETRTFYVFTWAGSIAL